MIPADPSQSVPVAIIGMGCMFPEAENLSRFWANIRNRLDAISEIPESHWKPEDYFNDDPKASDRTYARRGGFLLPVDFPLMEFGIAPNTVEATDTTQLLGLLVARQALEDAGYGAGREFNRDRASVILGVTGTLELVIPLGARLGHPIWRRALEGAGVDKDTADDVVQRISDSYVGWQENSFPGLLGNVAAGRIANRLDLGGTNCVVDAACASSLGAINLAMLELASGRSDMVISGGLDTFNDIFMYMCFSKTPALSPTGNARPFDAGADGTILGEGLGVVVLKRLVDAQRDGDRIYAVIRSMGTSSDGKGQAIYAPDSSGQAKALRKAYELAGVTPETIELIEAHGTGTKVGDAVELAALDRVYAPHRKDASGPWCALGSVKSQVGHTKAAAGAAGLIKAALSLHHKVIPPTIKVSEPMESLADPRTPFYVNSEARPWLPRPGHPRRAAVSAFGFGGSNFHCLLEEADAAKPGVDWDGDVQILGFSSDTAEGIQREIREWPRSLSWDAFRVKASESRRSFRSSQAYRLLLVVERGKTDLAFLLDRAIAQLESSGFDSASRNGSPRRVPSADSGFISVGQGAAAGSLAVLFPGQGSQYVGMLGEIACQFPEMQSALSLADDVSLAARTGTRLSERIYPYSKYRDADRLKDEETLRETQNAQPAIGSVSLGLLKILESFGIRGDFAAGHSFGELTALRAAGWIDDRGFSILANRRGELMSGAGDGQDAGSMIAVMAPVHRLEQILREHRLDLIIANRNAPNQNVLSGASDEILRAETVLNRQGIGCKILPVSRAFHSRFVSSAERPFRATLDQVTIRPTAIPVYSNTTGKAYPPNSDEAREILAAQLSSPVDFVGEIESMYQAGARVFLEIGPDAKLSGLVRSILGDRKHTTIAIDSTRGESGNIADLARAVASLAALGFKVDLSAWDPATAQADSSKRKPGLTVKVCGAHPTPKSAGDSQRAAKTPPPAVQRTIRTPAMDLNGSGASRPESVGSVIEQTKPTQTCEVIPVELHHQNGDTMKPTDREPLKNGLFGSQTRHSVLNESDERIAEKNSEEAPAAISVRPLVSAVRVERTESRNADAIQSTLDSLGSLQRLAERTAQLHQQFLEGQEQIQKAIQSILEQQSNLLSGGSSGRLISSPRVVPAANFVAPLPVSPVPSEASSIKDGERTPAENTKETYHPSLTLEPISLPVSPRLIDSVVDARQDIEKKDVTLDPGVTRVLLEVVSEKTGYPPEMLELGMALDSDLGIDSIKRVEILSALQDRLPGCPAFLPEQLSSIRTLQDIVELSAPADTGETSIPLIATPTTPDLESKAPSSTLDPGVTRVLLEVVSEKTGYPPEMLELGMALDSDLGIDSIKRVEILSALQDRLPGCPAFLPEQLSSIRTLQDIVELSAPTTSKDVEATPPTLPPSASPDAEKIIASEVTESEAACVLLEVVSEKTGYPPEMLELGMALDSDLGIDSIKRVEILSALQDRLPGCPAFLPEQLSSIRTLQDIVESLPRNSSVQETPPPSEWVTPTAEPQNTGPQPRCYVPIAVPLEFGNARPRIQISQGSELWIVGDESALTSALRSRLEFLGHQVRTHHWDSIHAITPPARLAALMFVAPARGLEDRLLLDAFTLMRQAGSSLRRPQEGSSTPALLTVTCLDGQFGLSGSGLMPTIDPRSGALSGLVKTARLEWPEINAKALDIDLSASTPDDLATFILDELVVVGPSEVGYTREKVVQIKLVPEEGTRANGHIHPARSLSTHDVVVISGGARGVTAEVAVSIAASFRPIIILLGRTPQPQAEPEWLVGANSEMEIKKAILQHHRTARTPQAVNELTHQILAQREISRNLDRMTAAGSRAYYHAVDVLDVAEVQSLLRSIQEAHGPVRGLIHGAGVLADRRIEDLTEEQFSRVFDTKVRGLDHLYSSIDHRELKLLAVFSSSTARFGRIGQAAYAAANEALNKWAQRQRNVMPGCFVASFNWGPWDGGMVTAPLKKMFEEEGLGLIPLEAGARLLVDRFRTGGQPPVEVVVLAGDLPREIDSNAFRSAGESVSEKAPETSVHGNGETYQTVLERKIDLDSMPILQAHVIDGHAVVPMVLIMEWLCEAALQRNPGFVVRGLNDLRLMKGIVLRGHRGVRVKLRSGKPVRRDDEFVVPVELIGTMSSNGREVTHAKAEVILSDRLTTGTTNTSELKLSPPRLAKDAIYRDILFHGPKLQGLLEIEGQGERSIAARVAVAPSPGSWLAAPTRREWLTEPLAIDSAFQLVVLWGREVLGTNSLPTAIGSYRQFRRSFPNDGVRVAARIKFSSEHRVVAEIDFVDDQGALVARIDSYECVLDSSLNQAFRRNRLATGEVARVS